MLSSTLRRSRGHREAEDKARSFRIALQRAVAAAASLRPIGSAQPSPPPQTGPTTPWILRITEPSDHTGRPSIKIPEGLDHYASIPPASRVTSMTVSQWGPTRIELCIAVPTGRLIVPIRNCTAEVAQLPG